MQSRTFVAGKERGSRAARVKIPFVCFSLKRNQSLIVFLLCCSSFFLSFYLNFQLEPYTKITKRSITPFCRYLFCFLHERNNESYNTEHVSFKEEIGNICQHLCFFLFTERRKKKKHTATKTPSRLDFSEMRSSS